MAGPIRISVLADARNAVRGINDTGQAAERLGTKFRGAAAAAAKYAAAGAALAAGAAVIGLGKLAAGAAEDQAAAAQLAQTLKTTTGATKAQVGATEDYISRVGVATGITDDELRPALSKLATATGSVSKAQKATTLATNVAAGAHVKLEAVTKTLAKAYTTGSVTALSKFGIAAKNADGSTKTLTQATAELGAKFGGAVATKADTLQGKIDRLKLIVSEAGESIGYKLIPPLTKFAEFILSKGLPAAQRFGTGLVKVFGPIVSQVGALIGPVVAKVQGILASLGNGSSALTPFANTLRSLAGFVTGTVVPAVSQLAGYLVSTVGPILAQVAGIVQTRVLPILTSLAAFFVNQLLPAAAAIASKIATSLKPIFDQLAATVQTSVLPTVRTLLAKFQEAQPTLQKIALTVLKVVGKFLEFTAAVAGKVLPVVIRLAGFLIANVVPAVASVVVALVKIIGKLIDFGGAVVDAVKKVTEFATKVARKIADVVGFFTDLPGKIKNALGDAGQILLTIGGQIIDGLKAGIDNAAHKVTDAVTAIIDKIPKKIREIMGIASPSKVTTYLGRMVTDGLAVGLASGTEGVTKVLDDLSSLIEDTLGDRLDKTEKQLTKRLKGDKLTKAKAKAEKKTKGQQQAIAAALADQYAALRANAATQDAITASLKDAQDAYDALVTKAQQYADTVRDAVVASGSVTGLGQGTGFSSVDQLIEQLRAKVASAQTYAQVIQSLTAAGLNQTNLQQLIDAGVEGGLGTAQAILDGGPSAIAQINALTGQLVATGTSLGQTTSQNLYGAGVQAAAGLVAGLQSQLAAVVAAAQQMGNAIAAAIKKALKIKSPSRVFRQVGRYTAQGLVLGLQDVDLADAGDRMARTLTESYQRAYADAPSYVSAFNASASSTQTMSLDLRLSADEIDQLSRGRSLRADLDAYDRAGGWSRA